MYKGFFQKPFRRWVCHIKSAKGWNHISSSRILLSSAGRLDWTRSWALLCLLHDTLTYRACTFWSPEFFHPFLKRKFLFYMYFRLDLFLSIISSRKAMWTACHPGLLALTTTGFSLTGLAKSLCQHDLYILIFMFIQHFSRKEKVTYTA